ncbi:hypothetical protein [Dechloromonas denitrificans]|uniref:hypothetical protein n=1 Tax=Dechloromonas denitrificans TaxID=281362 RepID=UPI001CF8B97E|nr:hypothetical protein [Dechloromonas denitrificans]UCV02298.1 hypothetical protein KI611_14525 [Dechloromonas denitrificans]
MTVRYSEVHGELRCFEADDPGDYDDYDAFCNVQIWRPRVACLRGLKGTISRKIMRQIVGVLAARGVAVVYAERAPHRKLPFARRIPSGDFAGMWRLDIEEIRRAAT